MINSESFREFFLCPVTVESAGIMSYYVRPSGPAIEPESTEPLPPGNYGWYHDRECLSRGFPELSRVRQRLYTFQYRLESAAIEDPFPASTVARNDHRCRFTGSTTGTVMAWIIPPAVSWETDEWGDDSIWDKTPFIVDANMLPMHNSLVFYFHSNHFTVDVDDDYRILVLRAMGDAQLLLPTHLPHQDAAVNHFLRLHCRYSLCLMLRGGDIEELRVNYTGGEDHEESEMAPLDDERWQTVLYESGCSDSGSDTPDDNSQPVAPAPRRRWVDMNDPVNQQRYAAFLGADWSNQRSPLPIG
ncbi:hypothetical protein B0H11DRAFT_2043940 [Mycena galericulata]|nr:hypothetical protein B0H11DRAFT_2043940 [Mycena galericulata]